MIWVSKKEECKDKHFFSQNIIQSNLQKSEEVMSTCYEMISIHYRYIGLVLIRETIERWTLLTVETEVNGESKSKNERGSFLAGLLGLSCQ